jgi:hypothetical protein
MLQRISAWGLLAGWLILAVAAKTLRGDGAGMWVLLSPILVIGIGLLLVSSIGVYAAMIASGTRSASGRQISHEDTENRIA